MDKTAQLKAAIAAVFFERRRALYLQTGNPIHVWQAYILARLTGVPIPLWVLEYLDRVAGALTAPNGPTSPKAFAGALGLATKGGPSKSRQAKTDERDFAIVERIWILQGLSNRPDVDLDLRDNLGILQRVAGEYGLSLEQVRRIYHTLMRPRRPAIEPPEKVPQHSPGRHRHARARRPRRTNS